MKHKKPAAFIALIFCIFLWICPPAFSSDRINWHNYKEGMELGKKDRKKVFLYFFTDWCTYCKDMEKVTFKDRTVIETLNRRFIPVRVNAEKEKVTASNYNLKGFPTNWFIDENGETISNRPGYIPPGMLLNMLKYIHTDSYKSMTFKSFMASFMNAEKR